MAGDSSCGQLAIGEDSHTLDLLASALDRAERLRAELSKMRGDAFDQELQAARQPVLPGIPLLLVHDTLEVTPPSKPGARGGRTLALSPAGLVPSLGSLLDALPSPGSFSEWRLSAVRAEGWQAAPSKSQEAALLRVEEWQDEGAAPWPEEGLQELLPWDAGHAASTGRRAATRAVPRTEPRRSGSAAAERAPEPACRVDWSLDEERQRLLQKMRQVNAAAKRTSKAPEAPKPGAGKAPPQPNKAQAERPPWRSVAAPPPLAARLPAKERPAARRAEVPRAEQGAPQRGGLRHTTTSLTRLMEEQLPQEAGLALGLSWPEGPLRQLAAAGRSRTMAQQAGRKRAPEPAELLPLGRAKRSSPGRLASQLAALGLGADAPAGAPASVAPVCALRHSPAPRRVSAAWADSPLGRPPRPPAARGGEPQASQTSAAAASIGPLRQHAEEHPAVQSDAESPVRHRPTREELLAEAGSPAAGAAAAAPAPAERPAAAAAPATAQAPAAVELPSTSSWLLQGGQPASSSSRAEPAVSSTAGRRGRRPGAAAEALQHAGAARHALAERPAQLAGRRGVGPQPLAGFRLQDDPVLGQQLLRNAPPHVASMPVAGLVESMQHGRMVHKAWARISMRRRGGGAVRLIRVRPGPGGQPLLAFSRGWFRPSLSTSIRRVALPAGGWAPGAYIVLDTGRGMLRLRPSSAADMACWALGLNAVLLAAAGADAAGMGAAPSMPWSAAVLVQ